MKWKPLLHHMTKIKIKQLNSVVFFYLYGDDEDEQ